MREARSLANRIFPLRSEARSATAILRLLFAASLAVLLAFVLASFLFHPYAGSAGEDTLAEPVPGRSVTAALVVLATGLWLAISVYRYIRSSPKRYGKPINSLSRVL
jgi:hypothetical protein